MAHQTQAQILATKYAGNLANGVLATIEAIHKMAKWLTYGVMLVSYAHQSAFLYKLFSPSFGGNFFEILEGVSLLLGALLIPGLFDLAIIAMIRIMSTVGMNPQARKWARIYLPAPVLMSGTVNVLASHTYVIASVFVMVVSLIAVIEHLHSMVEPHFPTIDALERRTVEAIVSGSEEVQSEASRELDPMEELVLMGLERARQLAGYDRMSAGEKQSWSRRYKATERRLGVAPISPAPVTNATV